MTLTERSAPSLLAMHEREVCQGSFSAQPGSTLTPAAGGRTLVWQLAQNRAWPRDRVRSMSPHTKNMGMKHICWRWVAKSKLANEVRAGPGHRLPGRRLPPRAQLLRVQGSCCSPGRPASSFCGRYKAIKRLPSSPGPPGAALGRRAVRKEVGGALQVFSSEADLVGSATRRPPDAALPAGTTASRAPPPPPTLQLRT